MTSRSIILIVLPTDLMDFTQVGVQRCGYVTASFYFLEKKITPTSSSRVLLKHLESRQMTTVIKYFAYIY